MGFVVLHIQKPKGNDARTTAHIERTVDPANADQSRTNLNENLILSLTESRTEHMPFSIVSKRQG
jgi:hypothetical protein